MITKEVSLQKLGESISKEGEIIKELGSAFNHLKKAGTDQEKKMISSHIEDLRKSLKRTSQQIIGSTEKISLLKPLKLAVKIPEETERIESPPERIYKKMPVQPVQPIATPPQTSIGEIKKIKPGALEKLALKRMTKKEKKVVKKKERKANKYAKVSSGLFYDLSMSYLRKGKFRKLKRDLVKGNMNFIPANYISIIFFTTFLSIFVALLLTVFFLFFSFVASPPFFVRVEESIGLRLLKISWILILIPAVTFLFTYFYPSLEKRSLENKIDRELPFVAIHMSSISSSMIEPSKIFNIIITAGEYPNVEKEFIKLQNEINIYGYDLVTSLRNRSFNSPSKKLSELFNGLATTITSGGNLPDFFEKRSQSLLFEHRLEMEKQAKASETFMDIYISVVIAAPMILMLLLMMMRISGLGISLSTSMITLVMILGVTLVNILFLTFLHLKHPKG